MNEHRPRVGIIMGSDSDLATMNGAISILEEFDVAFEVRIVSAHRTPEEMLAYARGASKKGLSVIIAGAGGAAHLPGMVASATSLPVIGVPCVPPSAAGLAGIDALLSIVQMPGGIPVAAVAIGNAKNAGLLAIRMLGISDDNLRSKLENWQQQLHDTVVARDIEINKQFNSDKHTE